MGAIWHACLPPTIESSDTSNVCQMHDPDAVFDTSEGLAAQLQTNSLPMPPTNQDRPQSPSAVLYHLETLTVISKVESALLFTLKSLLG